VIHYRPCLRLRSSPMSLVLLPLPALDFDPTEVAVSWQVLKRRGHDVVFATPEGQPGQADDIMITGRGLDPWGGIPIVRNVPLVGRVLRANADGRRAYDELQHEPSFLAPLHWPDLGAGAFDGILLPGGHRARGMRQYLESAVLGELVADFFTADKPVGAICHGVLLAARSRDPVSGRSVLYGRRTTALTWQLERTAWQIGRRTRFWDPTYYRTYMEEPGQPAGYMSVQQEVTRPWPGPRTSSMSHPMRRTTVARPAAGPGTRTATAARPGWYGTGTTSRPVGPVTRTPSPTPSPRCSTTTREPRAVPVTRSLRCGQMSAVSTRPPGERYRPRPPIPAPRSFMPNTRRITIMMTAL
jgi:putative intracellular protease/amidase